MLKNYVPFLFFLVSCSACVPTSATKETDKKYFDLIAFVDKQISELNTQKMQVRKKILLNNETDEIQTDTLNWEKELALFRESDINSPSFRDSYQIEEDKANRSVTYTAKESKLKVKEIKLIFDEHSQIDKVSVKQIKIFFSEDNQLYELQRDLVMELKNNLLSAYAIKGFQKVILKDSLIYQIEAVVDSKPQTSNQ